jgi:L-threonylcarbamoyladenylate synthase
LILKKRGGIDTGIARDMDSIGIRIPNSDFCRSLASEFGLPYTTTSANKSGEKPERVVSAILQQFGSGAHLIDLVIDAGELPERLPSTVVDVSSGEVALVREGAISSKAVADAIVEKMPTEGL